jgi:uncharacterized protein YdeI (BOF family)
VSPGTEANDVKEVNMKTRNFIGMRDLILIFTMVLAVGAVLAASPAEAANPYAKSNNSWISISGTVRDVKADRFTLDYGKGEVTVEMDDGDRDADGYKLLDGDKVTVNGMIDRDLFEKTKIEAGSVYVEKLGTTFYASSADEEDYIITNVYPVVISNVDLYGTVSDVKDGEFTLNTGSRRLSVEVDQMLYDPLDEVGYQKIEKGDFVKVSGYIDYDLLEGREVEAQSVIELID